MAQLGGSCPNQMVTLPLDSLSLTLSSLLHKREQRDLWRERLARQPRLTFEELKSLKTLIEMAMTSILFFHLCSIDSRMFMLLKHCNERRDD